MNDAIDFRQVKKRFASLLAVIILCCRRVSWGPMNDETDSQSSQAPLVEDVAAPTIRKLDRRFLLLCAGVIFLSYVDRSSVVYAANDLCQDLKLTHEEYGNGVSLFYVGYLLSEMAGNVMLNRFGAPAWISFILFAWGCVGATTGFIQNATQFYVLRFAVGIAHGGSFPAIWYIIPMFYPPDYVTDAYSVIFAAISFSMPLSSPLFAGLLSLGPSVNAKGWRLLFVVGGIIPMLYAVLVYLFLPASPEKAPFLTAEEIEWIIESRGGHQNECDVSFWEAMKRVVANATWRVCTACCVIAFGMSSVLMFWATLLIQDMLYGDGDGDGDGPRHAAPNTAAQHWPSL